MSAKVKPWGTLEVESGLVCFCLEDVKDMAHSKGMNLNDFVKDYSGVICEISSPGYLRVDTLTAITKDHDTYDVVMIGTEPKKFKRFLQEDEPDWIDYLNDHPMREDVGGGDDPINSLAYEVIVSAYKVQLSKE